MSKTLELLWNKVNGCDSLEDCENAESEIRASNISNDDFDELMRAVTFIYREISKRG